MKKRLASLLLAAAMLLGLTACGSSQEPAADSPSPTPANTEEAQNTPEQNEPRVVTDMLGREVELPDEINTIATFKAIGVLNTLVETLGAGDKICNAMTAGFLGGSHDMQFVFAPQIADAPTLESNDGEILIEEVLKLDPDLCLVAWEAGVEELEDAGMCVVYVNWTNGDELKEAVTLMGEILGEEDVARQYCDFFDETVARAEEMTAGIADEDRRTALYGSAVSLRNPHKISEWWITEAGGISVTQDIHGEDAPESVEYTMEDLLAWNPDVMFLSGDEREELLADSNYATLTAVQNDELYRVPTVGHSWGNRSTEQPLVILWGMCKMYPDLYSEEELAQDIDDFYSTFFQVELTDEQIAHLAAAINDVKMFNVSLSADELKAIFACKPEAIVRSNNNRLVAFSDFRGDAAFDVDVRHLL